MILFFGYVWNHKQTATDNANLLSGHTFLRNNRMVPNT
jgi:hypothetical protein